MCTQDVTGRLYTAVISRNWAKKLCISHLCSRVQPQHAKSNMCFAIVSLIAGFVLLQIFAGKPNNSSSRTKHFASFSLGSDLSSFLSFFASFFFFLPHHSFKPADRVRKSPFFTLLKFSATSTARVKVVWRLSSLLRELCRMYMCCQRVLIKKKKKCSYQISVPAPRHS